MTATTSRQMDRWDPDALADLEHERDILLRELREVDAQHRVGELDPEQHAQLRDELTGRAADVLTLIANGRAARPQARPRSWRTGVTLAGLVLAAAMAGWVLTAELAPRVPSTAASTAAASTPAARRARLRAVVQQHPDDVVAHLALARFLLQQQDLPAALDEYDAAAAHDPGNVEALTYGGWVAVLTGRDGGQARLDRAVQADPNYPDAHALRGLTLMRDGDTAGAVTELQRYLELAPGGPLAGQVASVVDRLRAGQ